MLIAKLMSTMEEERGDFHDDDDDYAMSFLSFHFVFSAPNFVSSMQYEDFVFFYFRETSQEYTNCGKVKTHQLVNFVLPDWLYCSLCPLQAVYSRVGRVCKSDRGFPRARGSARNRWTTFFKARLNCSIPGEFPFYFDEIRT